MINLKASVEALREARVQNPQAIRKESAAPAPVNTGFSANPQNPRAAATKPKPDPLEDLALLGDDRRWLKSLLAPIPVDRHGPLLEGYRARWLAAYELEAVDHRKDNAGRRSANIWIRERLSPGGVA